jgi:large subunit ribosomal protein L17
MRHRMRGRKLGRNASHRRAMFRNMASSLICSVRVDEDDPQAPKVPGRIVTTVAKAKELRPYVERLVTMARKSLAHAERASEFSTSADRNSEEWKSWRKSEEWNKWNQAIAPAINFRRRAFALLRDKKAVDVLFAELAERFEDRPGGYTRVIRLADVRLGDAGEKALIEFVGENDRVTTKRTAAPMVVEDDEDESAVDESAAGDETAQTEAETAQTAGEEPADDEKQAEA